MNAGAKTSFFALCFFLSVLLATGDLWAHGGRFRGPKVGGEEGTGEGDQTAATYKGVSFPGGGPQVPFDQARWEFWWDYNHEPLVGLKAKLFSLTPEAGAIDFPYEKVTPANRTKLIRSILTIYRKAKEPQLREAAVFALARSHDESVIPWLEFAYEEDPHLYVRTIAIICLGISQVPAALPILSSIFNDTDVSTEMRSYAAVAAGLAGGSDATALFKQWLEPKTFRAFDRFLQQAVAFGAGLTEDTGLGPYLRSALVDNTAEDRLTRSYLVLSLGRLRDRAANAILIDQMGAKDVQIRRSATIALGITATPSDKDAVESLIRLINEESDYLTRSFGFIALGSIGGEEVEKFLVGQLGSVTRAYLPFTGLSIGLTRDPALCPPVLKKFVEAKDLSSRGALALALGLLGNRDAIGDLRKAFDQEGDPVYRGYYALGLGMLGDTESVERLSKVYLNSNDVELHHNATLALGLLGDRSFLRDMYALLGNQSEPIIKRLSTAYNLGFLGDQKSIDSLTAVINDTNETESMRSFAMLGLSHLIDTREIPVVSNITRDNNYTILDNFLYELYNIP